MRVQLIFDVVHTVRVIVIGAGSTAPRLPSGLTDCLGLLIYRRDSCQSIIVVSR